MNLKRILASQQGFTLIELLMAMAVFSFMMLIISVGFINVVRMHNQALASNTVQDNTRAAMEELVRAVRDSAGVVTPAQPGQAATTLCLAKANGPQQIYYVDQTTKILYRAEDCAARLNAQAVTSTAVQVADFQLELKAAGPDVVKPEVNISLMMASNNGTTQGSGKDIVCGPDNLSRQFCAVVRLTSGAVPR